jgi:hypothetical protein
MYEVVIHYNVVFEHSATLVDRLIHVYTTQFSMELHKSLIESPLSPCFHVNATTRFGHIGPSSGIYDDSPELLHCTRVLHSP